MSIEHASLASRGWCLLAAAAMMISGCGGRSCPTQLHSDPLRALEQHRGMRAPVAALRAEARVDQRGAEGRIRGTVLMFVRRPDRVRFDAMTQFGPAAILTSDGSNFQLLDLREERFLEGPTCPSNIARLLGIPLSGEELAQFLVGDTPRIEAEARSIACGRNGNYWITLSAADGRRQEIELAVRDADRERPPGEQHSRLIRSELFNPDGSSEWRVTFEDHRLVEDPSDTASPRRGVALPHRAHFVGRGADTVVRLVELELNPEVPAEAFSQAPPPGLTPTSVACSDGSEDASAR